jgi:hypothetical protein
LEPERLIRMSQAGAAVCDGRGVEAVIRCLENFPTGDIS